MIKSPSTKTHKEKKIEDNNTEEGTANLIVLTSRVATKKIHHQMRIKRRVIQQKYIKGNKQVYTNLIHWIKSRTMYMRIIQQR